MDLAGRAVPPFTEADNDRWLIVARGDGLALEPRLVNRSYTWTFDLPLPDIAMAASIRLEGTPSASVRLMVRTVDVGSSFLGYALHVRPTLQQYRLELLIGHGDHVEEVTPWTRSDAIEAFELNRLELRARGDLLQPFINGRGLDPVRDATIGRGRPRLTVLATDVGDRFVIGHTEFSMVE